MFPASVNEGQKGALRTIVGVYRLQEGATNHVDAIAGGRYLWLDADVRVDRGLVGISGDRSALDAVVGLRGEVNLNDQFYLTYYADVGGGQSNSTWQALAWVNFLDCVFDLVGGY